MRWDETGRDETKAGESGRDKTQRNAACHGTARHGTARHDNSGAAQHGAAITCRKLTLSGNCWVAVSKSGTVTAPLITTAKRYCRISDCAHRREGGSEREGEQSRTEQVTRAVLGPW